MRSAQEKREFRRVLEERTRAFSVSVFKYLDALPRSNSLRVIVYQLGKSASSIGANYREANRGESSADFTHKIAIALKECSESHYWLEILAELHPESQTCRGLLSDCDELLKIFQSIKTKMRQKPLP